MHCPVEKLGNVETHCSKAPQEQKHSNTPPVFYRYFGRTITVQSEARLQAGTELTKTHDASIKTRQKSALCVSCVPGLKGRTSARSQNSENLDNFVETPEEWPIFPAGC